MIIPTEGIKVHQHPLATLWFDHDGILHKISKKTPRTIESVKDLYSLIKRATKGKKVCALFEVSRETASNKDVRKYLEKEIPQLFSAVALLSKTPIGETTGILISTLAPSHIPTKVFKDEDEARHWLKDYVHLC
jgi:hypothetical protein